MKIDLDHIERAARAATKGPWDARQEIRDGRPIGTWKWVKAGADVDFGSTVAQWCLEQDAEHIAACSPDVVLALVAKLRSAESAIRYLWDAWSDAEGEGQPEVSVFGDAEMDEYLRAQGEEVERAPADVQQSIREARRK